MTKLKLGVIQDDKPIKLTVELPATVHRNLVAYAEALGKETNQPTLDPAKIIAPMLQRFMVSDRAFGKLRRQHPNKAVSAPKTSSDSKTTQL
jgi:hypothetical protein